MIERSYYVVKFMEILKNFAKENPQINLTASDAQREIAERMAMQLTVDKKLSSCAKCDYLAEEDVNVY